MSITVDRLASLIQRELANIVNEIVKNKKVGYINLTEVKVTKDISYATTYYTILSDEKEIIELAQSELDKFKVQIRMELAKKNSKRKKNTWTYF